MDKRLREVVVLGGGSAGWLVAALLAAEHGEPRGGLRVTLVESPAAPPIGVGEGTWPSMRDTLRRIESEGYSLHLVLDCKRDGEAQTPAVPRAAAGGEPVFRINGDDLFFLRSCGIDPTRRRRRSG